MTQGVLNPVKLPSDLNPAEKKFAACLGERKPCVVGNGKLPDLQKPIEIESGDAANVVRGEVIRFFAYGGDGKNPVRGSVIDLQGAWISGDLDLTHANIPYALLFGNCHFADSVVMQHAECAALNLGGSHLAKGLQADGLTTKGGVYLRKGFSAHDEDLCEGFSADDEVRLSGASIGGQLDCVGGEFHNPKGFALVVEHAKIGEGLHWRRIKGEGVVNLSSAKAGVLADDLDSWKPFKVILDGFTYDQFVNVNPVNAKSRIEWLANRPSKLPDGIPLSFSPLPYEQAAKALFGMGHASDARKILLEKERQLSEHGKWKWWQKPLRWLWEKLAGYGYQPARTFVAGLIVIAVGFGVFWFADESGRIVPHQPAALASVKYQYGRIPSETPGETVARKFPGYPGFNPLLFSADIFVPLLNLHQEPFWYPAPDGGRPSWFRAPKGEGFSLWFLLEWWYWFQIAAGAVLTSMFLLSVTGLLRPRQSSGEKG